MNLLLLPYLALGLGILSFGIWWWAYLKEARNPIGKPPNMWMVTLLHLFFVAMGLLTPFFLNPVTQQVIFAAIVGVATFVLLGTMVVGLRSALK